MNFFRRVPFHRKTTVCLKYFGQDCSITNLATTTGLTAVENKTHNGNDLIKKTYCNAKISDVENKISGDYDHDKYIATQEFN